MRLRFRVADGVVERCDAARARELHQALDELNAAPPAVSADPAVRGVDIAVTGRGGVEVRLSDETGEARARVPILWSELMPYLRDYQVVIRRIMDAQLHGGDRFAALDYGKKVVHDEGAEALRDLLDGTLALEPPTARQLFTLLFLLETKLPAEVVKLHRRHG